VSWQWSAFALRSPPEPAAAIHRAHLGRNQQGAIVLLGLFIAIALVGLLFYLVGIGQAVFQRERMQDAADAVALATAIGHARGMNLLVFINLVMAALVAIVLALKVVELLLTALTLILTAVSWLVPPAAAAVPLANTQRSVLSDLHESAREIVDEVLLGLSLLQRAVKVIAPAQSVGTAQVKVPAEYSAVIDRATGVPSQAVLPVEDDEYNTLCRRSRDVLAGLSSTVVQDVPFSSRVLGSSAAALSRGVGAGFCFPAGDAPDGAPARITRMLPIERTPGKACEADTARLLESSRNCQAWQEELLLRHPEPDGTCVDHELEPRRSNLCSFGVEQARVECDPELNPDAQLYSWSEQEVEERVVFNPRKWRWQVVELSYVGAPRLINTVPYAAARAAFQEAERQASAGSAYFSAIEATQPPPVPGRPCDNEGERLRDARAEPWSSWNPEVEWDDLPGVVRPLCDKRQAVAQRELPYAGEVPPRTPGQRLPPGINPDGYVLRYPAVKHVYGCSEEAVLELHFPDSWTRARAEQAGQDLAPQRLQTDTALGSEAFQIRGMAAAFVERRSGRIDRGLRLGAFGNAVEPEGWVMAGRGAGKLSVAQAEYYFNHDGQHHTTPEEWLWNMDWKARLVRFRLPEAEPAQPAPSSSDLTVASLAAGTATILTDITALELPPGAPRLESIEPFVVH
jgi:hypothetical protein